MVLVRVWMSYLTIERFLPRYYPITPLSSSVFSVHVSIVFLQESSLRKQPSFRWANYDSPVKSPTRPAPDPPHESPKTSPHRPEHDVSFSIVCTAYGDEDLKLISQSASPAACEGSQDRSSYKRGIWPPSSRSFHLYSCIKWSRILFVPAAEPRRVILEL
jgi:hypothetical protein